jgi:hypothetical protein
MKGKPGIAIRVEDASRALVSVDTLVPLVSSTDSLLAKIVKADGPPIVKSRLRMGEHSLAFAAIDGRPVYCTLLFEETEDPHESRWLLEARQKELARAFRQILGSVEPPSRRAVDEPAAIGPTFLVACAFETANLVRKSGHLRRPIGRYVFEGSFVECPDDWGSGGLKSLLAVFKTGASMLKVN